MDAAGRLDEIFARRTGRPIVVVVKGPPGSGRTDLAVQWVHHRHAADYPGGGAVLRPPRRRAQRQRPAAHRPRTLLLATGGFHAGDLPHSLDGLSALWRDWCRGRSIALVVDDAVLASQVRVVVPDEGDSAVLITEARELGALRVHTAPEVGDIEPMNAEASRELLTRIAGADLVAAEPEAVGELVEVCGGPAIALCVVGTMLADAEPDRPAARLARRLARRERVLHELSRDHELSVRAVLDAAYERMDDLTPAGARRAPRFRRGRRGAQGPLDDARDGAYPARRPVLGALIDY